MQKTQRINSNLNQESNIKINRTNTTNVKNAFYSTIAFVLRIPNIVFYALLFISLVVIEYYDFHLGPDLSIQLHTLKNFVNGNGISLTSLDANNNIIY
ncbi:MAG TPA: hypothetical protein VFI29_12970, partial [Hanamia sp.]|nr:hypothetical protein [Hanamia sp.]